MRRIPPLLVLCLFVQSCASPSRTLPHRAPTVRSSFVGEDLPPLTGGVQDEGSRTTIGVTLENDFFTGSDDNYTNGIGISYLSGPTGLQPESAFTRRWAEFFSFLPFIDASRNDTFVGWTIGQEMFTPDDISLPNPPLDDQPYAGILFIDFSFYGKNDYACHLWRLRAGIVGPHSAADDLQTWIHDIIDDEEPMGWDFQLPDEPVINLDYSAAFGLLGSDIDDTIAWRIVPSCTLGAGTYFTGAGGALYGEVGYNLGDTIGLLSLQQGLDPVRLVAATREDEPTFVIHAGGGGFAVGHFLPLDGTVFRDSRSVESEDLVGFVAWGLTFRWGRFGANYQLSYFTDQFETQRNPPEFGAVTLSWTY